MFEIFTSNYGCVYNNASISKELFVYEAGFEHCKPEKAMEYKLIDYYLIHYCIQGEGSLILNGKLKSIKKGDLFLIPPNTPNNYTPNPNNPWSYYWIGINGTICDDVLLNCDFTDDKFLKYYPDNEFLANFFNNIYISSLNKDEFKTLSHLYSFIDFLNNKNTYIRSKQSTGKNYLNKMLEFIQNNYYKDISVADISKDVNIDRTYVFKLFKKYLNTSPSKYMLNYRISKCATLIKNTPLSIQEISASVGFKHYTYFSKEFRAIFGVSPSTYRKICH